MKAILIVLVLFIGGCAGSVNMKNADRFYQSALEAEWSSDFENSRDLYYRSFVNARSASASKDYLSATLYGYGRMLGYTCNLVEAETVLKESLVLEREASGPISGNISKRLSELGQLSIALGKYHEASLYFEEAIPMLEKLGIIETDPVGYAEYLAIFANSLKESGNNEKAISVSKKSKELAKKHIGVKAKFTPVGYVANCESTKSS